MGDRATPPLERYARIVVVGVLAAIAIDNVYFAIVQWPLHDMDVYLSAASRLKSGQPLYIPGDVAVDSFWYAPWFAVAWMPLTFLPRLVVAVLWSGALLAATAVVTVMLARIGRNGPMLALLVGPLLFAVSAGGNIQALMVLSLVWGFNRGSGPFWVAIAASMKYTPILLALTYVARREWFRAISAGLLAAALIGPGFVLGLLNAGVRSQAASSLLGSSLPAYLIVVGASALLAIAGPQQYSTLASATAAVIALPRLFAYDVTLLAMGVAGHEGPQEPMVRSVERPEHSRGA
ncbi:MAG: DUF2029 domain-containing protein [Actinobacteria bacterium]|nr:MAG: DUF2029 domain-containing protein [Chloroflexota bacterium]TMK21344.1 MAG: DUF2029 domain-containing protein [Actinomycetota bacterium]